MGIAASKYGENVAVDEQENEVTEGSVPSTPILTPKTRTLNLDPRSPSTSIARTPIQVFQTPGSNKAPMKTGTTTEILKHDPRSPTTEFNRTPIIVENTSDVHSSKPRNKNLDKVKKELVTLTPATIKQKNFININKQNIKPSGLLETNLDAVETDLDTVLQEKSPNEKGNTVFSSLPLTELKNMILDKIVRSPNATKKVELVSEKNAGIQTPKSQTPARSRDASPRPHSPASQKAAGIRMPRSRSPVIPSNNPEPSGAAVALDESSQDAAGARTPRSHSPLSKDVLSNKKTPPARKKLITKTPDVSELDKKLTNLIYEDKDADVVPKVAKSNEMVRTPLGDRNSNYPPTKTTSKLKVSDKPTKNEQAVSKIPIFKDRVRGRTQFQCENTPPANDTAKNKKPQWDHDNTMII